MADDDDFSSSILTPEEVEKCKEAFDAFDKDSSGGIDQEELKTVLMCKIFSKDLKSPNVPYMSFSYGTGAFRGRDIENDC